MARAREDLITTQHSVLPTKPEWPAGRLDLLEWPPQLLGAAASLALQGRGSEPRRDGGTGQGAVRGKGGEHAGDLKVWKVLDAPLYEGAKDGLQKASCYMVD